MKKGGTAKPSRNKAFQLTGLLLGKMRDKASAIGRKIYTEHQQEENSRRAVNSQRIDGALMKANESFKELQDSVPGLIEALFGSVGWAFALRGDDAVSAISGSGGKVLPLSYHGYGNQVGTLCVCVSLFSRKIAITRLEWSIDAEMIYHRELDSTNGGFSYVDQASILDELRSCSSPRKLATRLVKKSTLLKEARRIES